MKNKRIFKIFSALCAALVLMMGLSVTAFAQGTDQPPAEDLMLSYKPLPSYAFVSIFI